ncbi:uncharacterized protein LOC128306815 [Anopheles moucheti]|uniref:uncharacterized protein LOC128306815 n=1 Tax=Anopheles moucheti TaxID=186751 RepID=UPI0022F0670A|nr:uncharacterized protein LOC128306815 [Anopheles moucheti]
MCKIERNIFADSRSNESFGNRVCALLVLPGVMRCAIVLSQSTSSIFHDGLVPDESIADLNNNNSTGWNINTGKPSIARIRQITRKQCLEKSWGTTQQRPNGTAKTAPVAATKLASSVIRKIKQTN